MANQLEQTKHTVDVYWLKTTSGYPYITDFGTAAYDRVVNCSRSYQQST